MLVAFEGNLLLSPRYKGWSLGYVKTTNRIKCNREVLLNTLTFILSSPSVSYLFSTNASKKKSLKYYWLIYTKKLKTDVLNTRRIKSTIKGPLSSKYFSESISLESVRQPNNYTYPRILIQMIYLHSIVLPACLVREVKTIFFKLINNSSS